MAKGLSLKSLWYWAPSLMNREDTTFCVRETNFRGTHHRHSKGKIALKIIPEIWNIWNHRKYCRKPHLRYETVSSSSSLLLHEFERLEGVFPCVEHGHYRIFFSLYSDYSVSSNNQVPVDINSLLENIKICV